MDSANENETWITTVAFTDENQDPVIPSSIYYRIDDVGSGTEIRGNTSVDPISDSVNIVWTPEDTIILNSLLPYETRKLTLSWEYGTDGYGTSEYYLMVKSLGGIPLPAETT